MYISKFNINNYKSYFKSGDLNLNQGINIITGQNNAGKTALLQSLSLKFPYQPHKSTKTLPTAISSITDRSIANIEFTISREDLATYVFDHFTEFSIPEMPGVLPQMLEGQFFFNRYLKDENVISCKIQEGQVVSVDLPLLHTSNNNINNTFQVDKKNQSLRSGGSRTSGKSSFAKIVELIQQRIYCFQAERLNISKYAFGVNSILNTDASNLSEVLNILQGDKIRFERYNTYIRKVFPQIFQISTRPQPNNQVEIVIWNEVSKSINIRIDYLTLCLPS